MTGPESAAAFAAFREVVLDEAYLMAHLRRSSGHEAFVAQALAAGAARGFAFDEAAVLAALRNGADAWQAAGEDAS